MTNVFIESGSKKSNEYIFIKAVIKQYTGKEESKDYTIVNVGGKDNLENTKSKFFEHDNDEEKNLVIFDADMPENHGGFEQRKKDLNNILNTMGVQFELFLFPNNKDNGMFEHLLERIINPNHKRILECFKNYEECLKQYKTNSGEFRYQTPDEKAKMYAYISAFKVQNTMNENRKNKGDWSFDTPEYWDLQSKALYPLKVFLQNHLCP